MTDNSLPRVLFACVHNAGRSQIAAALYKAKGGYGISAGTNPSDHVHPNVERCMQELGYDLSNSTPKKLDKTLVLEHKIDFIITMGCGENCPYVPGVKIISWNITDPKNMNDIDTKSVIEQIESQISEFLETFHGL
jgi:protein-tyrosine-phosphatase